MMKKIPRVSVGLPVYNGERYLEATLESLLGQTLTDFELIVADNASTDHTRDICLDYAARDSRIRYSRNQTNLGGSKNWSIVFHAARAPYFKWASHDDICAPTFLEKAADVLDAQSDVVLCYPRCAFIDQNGITIADHDAGANLRAARPSQRVRQLLAEAHTHCFPCFGLIRRRALAKTTLLAPYISSDQPLLLQLAMMGQFCEVPERLFFFREHPERSAWQFKSFAGQTMWYDPNKKGRIRLPRWRLIGEFVRSIDRAGLPWSESADCYLSVLRWCRWHRASLKRDLVMAARQLWAGASRNQLIDDKDGAPPITATASGATGDHHR